MLWYELTCIGLLGLLVGSFLNVVIVRLPRQMQFATSPNLFWPGSHCVHCHTPIRSYDNIPVLSYLFLKGQCRTCQKPISRRYPLIELLSFVLSIFVFMKFGFGAATLSALFFTWVLIVLSGIDIDHYLLPDSLTLSLLWVGLFLSTFNIFVNSHSAIWGTVFGYLALWSVFWIFKWVTKKEGLGFGDIKLLAALGAWVGWQGLPLIILISSFTGAMVGIVMIFFNGKSKNTPIPFGPFLAFAGWITLMWGDNIMYSYLKYLYL